VKKLDKPRYFPLGLSGSGKMRRGFTARWRVASVVGGFLLGLLLTGSGGCTEAFTNNCAATRSCPVPNDVNAAGEGGQAPVDGVAGDGNSAAGGQSHGGAAGSAGGGETAQPCKRDADCEDDDPANGEERCAAGACEPGDAPPRIVSITPADGAIDVEPDVVLSVVFSEPLDPATVGPDTFRVFAGTTPLAGTLKLSAGRDQVRFAPADSLLPRGGYRVEISAQIKDDAGIEMLSTFSSRFRAKDGAWQIRTLASADALELPFALSVAPSGSLLVAWLHTEGTTCGASGTWVFRNQSKASDLFESKLESPCSRIATSIARDGSAAAAWWQVSSVRTQSFVGSSWGNTERQGPGTGGVHFVDTDVFAHDAQHVSLLLDVDGVGGPIRDLEPGPARGDWDHTSRYVVEQLGSRLGAVFDDSGDGLAFWTFTDGVYSLGYDSLAGKWETVATVLPGTAGGNVTRSVPGVARSNEGDVLVAWVEGPANNQVLKSSRFEPDLGWDKLPVEVSSGLGGEPLFEAPAVVFDGETFVTAWTAATGGKLTTYSARYDLEEGTWGKREPHVSELGESAVLMPRLGVDAGGNLMLLWAVGEDPISLVYQRFDADAGEWGAVAAIPGASFSDAKLATEGKLPFAWAKNGLGGVMFRSDETDGSQTLKLASFF